MPRTIIAFALCDVACGSEVRSTQDTGKRILEAALRAVDDEAADAVHRERGWRFKYKKHFVKSVEISAKSPENALKVRCDKLTRPVSMRACSCEHTRAPPTSSERAAAAAVVAAAVDAGGGRGPRLHVRPL
eukprot:1752484-Pleurochrysis_carterae.AAC.1